MEHYLNETMRMIKSGVSRPRIVVSGNEACDLDSTVCALTYAFFKQSVLGPRATVIPLCNINRAEMNLRREVVHWLNRCNIHYDSLIYLDDLLTTPNCETKLVLVDHNMVTGRLASMNWPVVEVIDHHYLESADNQLLVTSESKHVGLVGSCATLVTELLLKSDHVDQMVPIVWELLYGKFARSFPLNPGAILIDTVGLSARGQKAGRLTDLDLLMATRIEDKIGCKLFSSGASRESLFQDIEEAKFNVDGMSVWDLLRRDTKLACGSNRSEHRFVCSTVSGLDLVDLLRAPDFTEMADRLCALNSASILVCITVGHWADANKFERRKGLIVYSPLTQSDLCQKLFEFMSDPVHELELRPEIVAQAPTTFTAIIQNPKVTRKMVLPVVKAFINIQFPSSNGSGPSVTGSENRTEPREPDNKAPLHPNATSYPMRSLDQGIQHELNYLRSWLASFDPGKRFELVYNTVSDVMNTLCPNAPSIELLKQIKIRLVDQAYGDRNFDAKLSTAAVTSESKVGMDMLSGDLILSDIGKALNRGRRLTMPATNDLIAYRSSKHNVTSKKRGGTFNDSHSLPDQENTKPSWLETEYLTHRSWLPDQFTKNSAEAVEAVSYRLYRRLSSVPYDGRRKSPEVSTFEFESADDSFSEPMDDAELALLRTSFADIEGPNASSICKKTASGETSIVPSNLLSSTSWPFTPQDTLIQRGLEWLRRSPKTNRTGSNSKPTTPSLYRPSHATSHGHVKFVLDTDSKYADETS